MQKLVEKLSLELELVKKERLNAHEDLTAIDIPAVRSLDLTRKGNALTFTLDEDGDIKSQEVQKLVKEITTREGKRIGKISIVVPDMNEAGKINSVTLYGDLLDKADHKGDLPGTKTAIDTFHFKADVKSKHDKEAKLKEGKEKIAKQEKAMLKLEQRLEAKRKETLELQREMEMMQLQMMELQKHMKEAGR